MYPILNILYVGILIQHLLKKEYWNALYWFGALLITFAVERMK